MAKTLAVGVPEFEMLDETQPEDSVAEPHLAYVACFDPTGAAPTPGAFWLNGENGQAVYMEANQAVAKALTANGADHPAGGPLCYVYTEDAGTKTWYFGVNELTGGTQRGLYPVYYKDASYHNFAYARRSTIP